jgi:fermentation-respiration switch protein FrsA (DUF1100 family)
MVRTVFYIILSYIAVAALLYAGQRHLQYFPGRSYPGKPANYGLPEMQELQVKTEDGLELLAWFAPPKKKDGKVIVLYHGNAGDISLRADKARTFIDAGYGVYLCEYRGFGGNKGDINEGGLYKDARSALQWLDAHGYPPAQWVIYGESIGSGSAVQMAAEFQAKGLILEGAFSSAIDVAAENYFWLPVRYMLKDRFDNISKIKSVHASLLMVHGERDPIIPFHLAQRLYATANEPKRFVPIRDGDHNDLYNHHAGQLILEWLETLE